jgi:hypothetical protein
VAKVGAQTKSDQRLARNVHNWYLDDASARRPREEEWDRSYKRLLPSYVDESKIKGPFKLKVPYCYRVLEVQTGQLMSQTEANGRWALARGLNPESAWTGEIVSDLIESQFRYSAADINLDNEMRMETCARLGLGYGNTAGYVEWSTYHKCCSVTALDPYDLFLDWRHNRHYIIRRVVTLGELEEMCQSFSEDVVVDGPVDPATGEATKVSLGPRDGGKAIAAFKRILKSVESGEVTGWLNESYAADHSRSRQSNASRISGSDDGIDEGQVTAKDDPYNARVTLLEYHETREEGIVAVIVASGGPEEGVVIRKERQPYGVCQIVPFVPRPVDKEVYGLGIPEVVGHTAEGMDIFYRAGLRWTVRVADPAVLYRKGLRLRQEYLRTQSGISIPVDDTVNDIRYMEPPHSANLHQMAFLFARSMADMGTGETDQRRGQVGGASSATEAAIAEAGASITDRRIFWRWRRFVQQVSRVMLEILKVHVTEEIAVPILGAARAGSFMRLKPEWLKGRYEVLFGGNTGGMTPVQRQAGFRNIAQSYAAAGVVDLAALARADLRELGVPDPDAFMTVKDQPENVPPRREHMALFDFGQDIEVSPKNDHMTHILSHMKEMQRRQGHPALPLLQEHLQIHMAAYQMQMAQQQQQQAQAPAGAAPMRPDQAGQPGQPASFQPATADVNAQRQQSNNGTPGHPPGPSTVPNRPVGGIAYGGPSR